MRVLITGGAGFIGSHLADRLLERGDDVVVIDNYATGRHDNLTPHPQAARGRGLDRRRGRRREAFAAGAPDVVVHAAAAYKDPDDWEEDSRTNVLGTANVVKATQAAGSRRLIYFQTALCYGLQPLEQPITLDHPVRPEGSSYAISKTGGEQYVALSDLDWVSFRLANAYGPRNISGPLPTFFSRLTNDKSVFVMDTRRDFIFIDDLTDCVMKAIDGEGRSGPYHISSGSDYSIKELYDATIKALELDDLDEVEVRPRNPDDAPTILLDPSRDRARLRLARDDAARGGRRAARSTTTATYGIEETFTHLKEVEPADEPADQPVSR